MVKKKIICIVQARFNSTRFKGKVLKKLNNSLTVLEFLICRLKKSKFINEIVVASTKNSADKKIVNLCKKRNFLFFVGSERDVLDRYYQANKKYSGDIIVRITSDCPLADPTLIDKFIKIFIKKKVDYLSNVLNRSFPDGVDIEIFKKKSLELAWKNATSSYDREHVTTYLRRNKIVKRHNIKYFQDLSKNYWSLDYKEDLVLLKSIVKFFKPNIFFTWKDVLMMKKNKEKIFKVNKKKPRTIEVDNNPGQLLWQKAKNVIPGGNMFLSKRPEMYLPNIWPAYFKKSKGCRVEDLSGNKYYDMTMGVGTNVLGYANKEVDLAVSKAIRLGNMSTLNCPEEVALAEKLIDIHKWAGAAKFARTGAEANAIALRIARCYNNKSKIAFCGYHGWQDWYLSANLNKKDNLSNHLLSNLSTSGVPKNLRNTVFPFRYRKFDELSAILRKHSIGTIVMEFSRNLKPDLNFLKKIRKIATRKNIVLIFDECTSGFRQCKGGIHNLYGINPDIATFGKCLGNGYAITSVVGKKKIMEQSEASFISSTFFSERIGYVAALKTLNIMERDKTWLQITKMGSYSRKKLNSLSKKYKIKLNIWGLPALVGFTIEDDHKNYFKTYITQEMLKNGFIFGNCIYLCIFHSRKIINKFFKILEKIFCDLRGLKNYDEVKHLLKGPPSHTTFKRLN